MKNNYEKTIRACFFGYIVQAIVNTFVPLLFITFQSQYNIPLSKITMLITFNFVLQLCIDFASAFFLDKIGYRAAALIAHGFAAAGLIMLAVLPEIIDPFAGLIISVIFYAVGGGLLEVIISPIVDSCPSEHKAKTMSMLHSFYCWGCVGVVVISAAAFNLFTVSCWRVLAALWALVPILNGLAFIKVPICAEEENEEKGLSLKELCTNRLFWMFIVLMCCAGASEQAVSQWSSAFAEKTLGISKSISDLAGPTIFSVLMGLSRAVYGKFGDRINLNKMMIFSTMLCIAAYLTVSLTSSAFAGLVGIAAAGFSVGILWPGTYSSAAADIKGGGSAMFAFLALAGDVGCAGGPTLAGKVAALAGDNLKIGILAAVVFPVVMLFFLLPLAKRK